MNAEQDDVRSAPGAPGAVPGGGDAPAPDAPPRALAMRVGASRTPLGLVLGGAAVVLALMVGNILSTPMRAVRHQLPSYTGFFRPALALRLILANQGMRAASMVLVTLLYYFL